ncbi:MAG TPA: hypothetical protein DCO69_02760 [Clostridiales bacterium]|nr:hypothetical protein [Clostridiales bacterium]
MKKALVMLLAVVLVIGMAVPAYAVSSPVGGKTSSTTTADLPKLTDESKGYVEFIAVEDAEKLSKESQATFAEAQTKLKDAAPTGMKTQYFCWCHIVGKESPVDVAVEIKGITELVVKQYLDGKWVELKSAINADGTATINGLVEGPVAIFTK